MTDFWSKTKEFILSHTKFSSTETIYESFDTDDVIGSSAFAL